MATSVLRAPVGLSSFALSCGSSRAKAQQQCSARLAPAVATRRVAQLKVSSPSFGFVSSSITETRLQGKQLAVLTGKASGGGALGATCALPVSPETLRWIFVAAASALLFLKNANIPRNFLVPLIALEIPRDVNSWFKGDYGLWTGFLALAVKLFYRIPEELELPLYLLLLVITAPFQLTQYKGSLPAAIVTLVVAGFLAYKHYQSNGSLKGSFEGEKIFPSLALVVLLVVPILYLVNGVYY